jgi:hypothetical protein
MTPDDDSMLDPEEYTVSVEYVPVSTGQVFIAETVKRAMEGDTDSARTIYLEFVSAIDSSGERTWASKVPWNYVRFVADRLRAVLDADPKSADVAAALVLSSGKASRPQGRTKDDHKAIAACYFRLLWAGLEPKAAKCQMKERIGVSEEAIEAARRDYAGLEHPDQFKSHHPDMRGSYFDCLEQLATTYRGIIAEIIAAERSRSD